MTKKASLSSVKFIELEDLQSNRFKFIENDVLRENISIKMQYIVFLISLEEEYELPGAVRYSTLKTIIIFTASIIEALLNYKLHSLISEGRIFEKDIMGKEERLSIVKDPVKISETEEIFGIKKVKKIKKLNEKIDFHELNRAAKRSGLFTENLFKMSEKIREDRNKIHAYSLKEVDDKYSKKDIFEVFSFAKTIIERVEIY